MKPEQLKTERVNRGWSQDEAARRFGVSQPYVVMLEKGKRPLTPALARKAMSVYNLSACALPASKTFVPERPADAQRLAEYLGTLGYPGYAYLRSHVAKKNPGEVLLTALAQNDLESRLVEALPWLLLWYWEMDLDWVVANAKKFDLQNRLGFVTSLAHKVSATDSQNEARTHTLAELESTLDRSRLVREDEFMKSSRNDVEREWLMQNRSQDASHWNLLTDLRPEHLGYDARTP
jgi:transcriptional regulator with XRE-family HTH domain